MVHSCVLSRFSLIQLFVTLWTVAKQAPLSMEFPRQPTGVGCHAFLQRIFPTQGSNLRLLHWGVDSLLLSHLGSQEDCFPFRISNISWQSLLACNVSAENLVDTFMWILVFLLLPLQFSLYLQFCQYNFYMSWCGSLGFIFIGTFC